MVNNVRVSKKPALAGFLFGILKTVKKTFLSIGCKKPALNVGLSRRLRRAGFTLIELLIVIAIIAVLVSVIINALNDARTSGLDARITAEMKALQSKAVAEESSAQTFDVVCGTNGETQATEIASQIATINGRSPGTAVCNSGPDTYAISIELVDTGHWCIDSAGNSREIGSTLGSGVLICPAS